MMCFVGITRTKGLNDDGSVAPPTMSKNRTGIRETQV